MFRGPTRLNLVIVKIHVRQRCIQVLRSKKRIYNMTKITSIKHCLSKAFTIAKPRAHSHNEIEETNS